MLPAHQTALKIQQITAELRRRSSQNSLESFIQAAWPLIEPKLPFVPGRHIGAICEHLEAVYAGEIRDLLINIPPRHAKSTIVSVGFPAWVWSREASKKFIYGSHSHQLAKRDSIKTRQVVQSHWYRDTFGIKWRLAEDQNEKSNFLNTEGGFRRATSVEATIIGEGGDILVLDDPHSPRSVASDTQRQSELDWMDEEFFTRINDPRTVSKIVIMQRLDQRDASAHLLAQGGWEHLMLPAEYESARKCSVTVLGFKDSRTEEGDPLWPERFDKEGLKVLKKMGAKAWAGQGQQRPAPAEGNIIKRESFKYYDVLPSDITFFGLSVDLSFDEGVKNSYAVFQIWGKRQADKYLIHQVRRQMGFTEQLSTMKILCNGIVPKTTDKRISSKWVEKKANGAAIINVLTKDIAGLLPVSPQGSKEARLEAVSPQFESGNIYVPNPELTENSWVPDYIEELVTFPGALHDDQVDATSQAIKMMTDSTPTDAIPISITGRSKWR